MSPRLLAPERPQLVHGHGVVELFNAMSGKTEERVEFENYISEAGHRWHKAVARAAYFGGMPQDPVQSQPVLDSNNPMQLAAWPDNEGWPLNPFTHIACSDNSDAEDTSTANPKPDETIIAWANRSTYAGADTKRGSPNSTESIWNSTLAKLVFDWPTSAGNGTFRTVEFLSLDESALRADSHSWSIGGSYFSPSRSISTGGFPTGATCATNFDRDSFWAAGSTQVAGTTVLQRVKYSDGTAVAGTAVTYSGLGSYRPESMQKDEVSGDLWMTENTADAGKRIRRYTASGTLVTSLAWAGTAPVGLAYGNSNLWVLYDSAGTFKVALVNQATGAITSEWNAPAGTGFTDLFYGDGYLWIWSATTPYTLWKLTEAGTVRGKMSALGLTTSASMNTAWMLLDSDSDALPWDKLIFVQRTTSSISHWCIGHGQTLGARTKLAADVTKTNLQTMKVTYQFDFT